MNCFLFCYVALFLQVGVTSESEIVFESKICDNVVVLESVADTEGRDITKRKNDKEKIKEVALKMLPKELASQYHAVNEICPVAYSVKIFARDHFLPDLMEEYILLCQLEPISPENPKLWCLGRVFFASDGNMKVLAVRHFGDTRHSARFRYTQEKPTVEEIRDYIALTPFGNQDFGAVFSTMNLEKKDSVIPCHIEVLKIYVYPEFAELEDFLRQTPSAEAQKVHYQQAWRPISIDMPFQGEKL